MIQTRNIELLQMFDMKILQELRDRRVLKMTSTIKLHPNLSYRADDRNPTGLLLLDMRTDPDPLPDAYKHRNRADIGYSVRD